MQNDSLLFQHFALRIVHSLGGSFVPVGGAVFKIVARWWYHLGWVRLPSTPVTSELVFKHSLYQIMKDRNSISNKKNKPSARQLREQQRARAAQRTRLVWIGGGTALFVLLGALIYFVANAPQPKAIEGIQLFGNLPGVNISQGPWDTRRRRPLGVPTIPSGKIAASMSNPCEMKTRCIRWSMGQYGLHIVPNCPQTKWNYYARLRAANPMYCCHRTRDCPLPLSRARGLCNYNFPTRAIRVLPSSFCSIKVVHLRQSRAPCVGGIGTPLES